MIYPQLSFHSPILLADNASIIIYLSKTNQFQNCINMELCQNKLH
jgi:hypothetical protein